MTTGGGEIFQQFSHFFFGSKNICQMASGGALHQLLPRHHELVIFLAFLENMFH